MAKITIHTPEEIEAMRRVGAEAADLLDFITPHVKAGVSTLALDELMLEYTVNVLKAKSACLGYNPGGNGVPLPPRHLHFRQQRDLPRHSEREEDS